jgi:hypothetical protein
LKKEKLSMIINDFEIWELICIIRGVSSLREDFVILQR